MVVLFFLKVSEHKMQFLLSFIMLSLCPPGKVSFMTLKLREPLPVVNVGNQQNMCVEVS